MLVATHTRADTAAAEMLFREAKRLVGEGDFAQACPKFEASLELDRQLGTLLNLADCQEQLGRVATAWARWGEALEWARQRHDRRLGYIDKRRSAVEARLPKLVVAVVNPVATLEIVRDGVPVPPASYGVAIPVDPGAHVLAVRRAEQVLEERSVTAVEAKTSEEVFDLAAIDAQHPAPEPPAPAPTTAPVPSAASSTAPLPGPADRAPPEDEGRAQRVAGWIVGGVGAAAVLTAGALEIAAIVKKEQADQPDSCVNKYCAPQGIDAAESAKTFAEAGQWLGVAGLATLAVGATLLLTAPSAPEAPAAARAGLTPWLGPSGVGLSFGGEL